MDLIVELENIQHFLDPNVLPLFVYYSCISLSMLDLGSSLRSHQYLYERHVVVRDEFWLDCCCTSQFWSQRECLPRRTQHTHRV